MLVPEGVGSESLTDRLLENTKDGRDGETGYLGVIEGMRDEG